MHNAWFLTTTSTTIQWLYKLIQCDSLLHVSTPAVLGLSLSKTTPSLIHMLSSPISNYKYIIKSCRQIIDPTLLNSSQPYPLLSQLSVIHNHITLLPHPFILSSATVVSMDFFHSLACRAGKLIFFIEEGGVVPPSTTRVDTPACVLPLTHKT